MASSNSPKAREALLAEMGYMSGAKLAKLLDVELKTVKNRRNLPARHKIGRDSVYRIADVQAWMARDTKLIDVAFNDAALAAQGIDASWQIPEPPATPVEAMIQRREDRLAITQSTYLGTIFGTLRLHLDEEFARIHAELMAYIAGAPKRNRSGDRE